MPTGPDQTHGGSATAPPWPQPRFAKFSVSILLLLQYSALVVLPAWQNDSPYLAGMLAMIGLALLGSFSAEFLLSPLRVAPGRSPKWTWCTPRAAVFVLTVGLVALVASAALGVGTYSTQVRVTTRTPLAPLLTPLLFWVPVGLAMLLFCFQQGRISRRHTVSAVGLSISVYLGYTIQIGRSAPLAAFTLSVLAGCVVVGLFRTRTIVIAMLVGMLIWPVLYELRNSVRAESGQDRYGQEITARERLREDVLMQNAVRLGQPVDIGQASIPLVLRYGLLPRAIDSGRPELRTGGRLSQLLGGSFDSSSTLTILGNIFGLGGGYRGLVVIPFFLAGGLSLLLLRLNPLTLALAMVAWTSLIWIESTWPDGLAGPLQAGVSALAAFALVRAYQLFDDAAVAALVPSTEQERRELRKTPGRTDW